MKARRQTDQLPEKKQEAGGPVVALANGYRFRAEETKTQGRIQSRAILWCRTGRGSVQVNRQVFEMKAGMYLLLPWNRRMVYQAPANRPMHVAAVHWIPFHAHDAPAEFNVAHEAGSKLADHPARQDRQLAWWGKDVFSGQMETGSALHHLVEYIVACFQARAASIARQGIDADAQQAMQAEMRSLAQLLESQLEREQAGVPPGGRSARLEALLAYMRAHADQRLGLQQLAEAGDCSRATVLRMFRQELRTSPVRWLTEYRVERACELLRTTAKPVHEIAAKVGMGDSHYFSNVFKGVTGVRPGAYRKAGLVV